MPKHSDTLGNWTWSYLSMDRMDGESLVYQLECAGERKAVIRAWDEDLLELICTLLNENELPPRNPAADGQQLKREVEARIFDEAGGAKREYTVTDTEAMLKKIVEDVWRKPNKRGEGEDV